MNNKTFWDAMKDLSPALFKTYAAISRLADNEIGYCFASNNDISTKLNKHEKSISRDVNNLITAGYLLVNNLKVGFKIIERRLYTAENFKTYLQDNKNAKNLIKTTYETRDAITYFYNEKNPKSTGNKSVTRKIASNKNEDCTGNNFEDGTGNKSVTLTNTNINNTKLTTTEKNKLESSSSSFEFLNILDKATKQNIMKTKPEITEVEFKEIYDKCKYEVEQGYAKNLNAILVVAIKGLWNFKAKEITASESNIKKISASEKKATNFLNKQNLEKMEIEDKQAEIETLKSLFETLPKDEQDNIMKEAINIAIKNGMQPKIAEIVARNETKYKVLKNLYY